MSLKIDELIANKIHITVDEDVGKNQNGSLIIGNKAGENIGIDGNEIMARNNSAVSTLYINSEGGAIQHGGSVQPSTNNSVNLGDNSHKYANVYATTLQGNATGIKDSGDGRTLTFAYSKSGLSSNPNWIAAWDGNELRAVAPRKLNVNYATDAGNADKLKSIDSRSTNGAPSYYMSSRKGLSYDFKIASVVGIGSSGFAGIITATPWGDNSGGRPQQIGIYEGRVYTRASNGDSSWGDWRAFISTENLHWWYGNVTFSSGYAQINISGIIKGCYCWAIRNSVDTAGNYNIIGACSCPQNGVVRLHYDSSASQTTGVRIFWLTGVDK